MKFLLHIISELQWKTIFQMFEIFRPCLVRKLMWGAMASLPSTPSPFLPQWLRPCIKYPIIISLSSFSQLGKGYFKDNSQDTSKHLGDNYRHWNLNPLPSSMSLLLKQGVYHSHLMYFRVEEIGGCVKITFDFAEENNFQFI